MQNFARSRDISTLTSVDSLALGSIVLLILNTGNSNEIRISGGCFTAFFSEQDNICRIVGLLILMVARMGEGRGKHVVYMNSS